MKASRIILLAACIGCAALTASCRENEGKTTAAPYSSFSPGEVKVTFIELGSVSCIPCQAMQPIMRDVEREFAGQVKVVFYDVKTIEGAPYGRQYGIRAIPTQVFLDKDGKEYFRHEGYFPKAELVEVLKQTGVR